MPTGVVLSPWELRTDGESLEFAQAPVVPEPVLGCRPPVSGRVFVSLLCVWHAPQGFHMAIARTESHTQDAVQGDPA